jgi:hypothetical protein
VKVIQNLSRNRSAILVHFKKSTPFFSNVSEIHSRQNITQEIQALMLQPLLK